MLFLTRSKQKLLLAPALAATLAIAACGGGTTTTEDAAEEGSETIDSVEEPAGGGDASASLTGAGASFPAPLYQRWFADYNKVNPDVQVAYQSVGSGAGVEQFTQETVDFGASDVAMKDEEIAAVDKGVVLLPMTAGSIVLAYNLPGVDNLKLSRDVYTDILLGNITTWNDPAIAAINEGVELPDTEISVIYRSDGSGTTGVFTKHLSAISPEFEETVGEGKTVEWPTGQGEKGNEGITAAIQQTEGAVGYIEYGYAKQQGISVASLENQAGNYIEPSEESAAATLAAVELPENLRAFIADPEGDESYPIVTYSWIMAYQNYEDPEKAEALKEVLTWALEEGQAIAPELGYIPLPEPVVERVKTALETIE
ncbi:MAG: phosphate ABC transporter substrate-binding protein PstS [Cyanobacteriota bacterium]|nr:phosphate ABC transporter substrate-binding protein PstS [Cyanobacteriota bacterium]